MAPMSRVIAVANQKGGVAKTTTVASLGSALAEQGRKVLLVDLDPQSCLTFSLGLDPDAVELSVHDVLLGRVGAAMAIQATDDGVDLLPATIDLAGTEAQLMSRPGREFVLRTALEEVSAAYDVVLLDCSPSLGVLTLNALTAADELIIPLQCEMLSHRGVGQLLDTVADVHRLLNPRLTVRGLLPTMYDGRSVHSRAVLADLQERFDLPVLPAIPRSIRFAEAPGVGGSILTTARSSRGAKAYREVAEMLIRAWRVSVPKARRATKNQGAAKKPAAAKKPTLAARTAPTSSPVEAKTQTKRTSARKPAG